MCCLNNILVSKFKKKEPTYFLLIFSKTTIKIGQKNWIVLHTFVLYSWKIMDNTSINIQTDMNGHTMTFALTCHVSGALTVWRVKQTRAQRRMGKCTWHVKALFHLLHYVVHTRILWGKFHSSFHTNEQIDFNKFQKIL